MAVVPIAYRDPVYLAPILAKKRSVHYLRTRVLQLLQCHDPEKKATHHDPLLKVAASVDSILIQLRMIKNKPL